MGLITDACPTHTDEQIPTNVCDMTESMSSWELIDGDEQNTSDGTTAQSTQIPSSTVLEPDVLSDVMDIMEKHSTSESCLIGTDTDPNASSEPLDRLAPTTPDETIARSSTILQPDLLPDVMQIMDRHATLESATARTEPARTDASDPRRPDPSRGGTPGAAPSRWDAELRRMRALGFLDGGRNLEALEYAASAAVEGGAVDPAAVLNGAVVLCAAFSRWETELGRLHELGFRDDGRSVDALERVESCNSGGGAMDCAAVLEEAVQYLLSD